MIYEPVTKDTRVALQLRSETPSAGPFYFWSVSEKLVS